MAILRTKQSELKRKRVRGRLCGGRSLLRGAPVVAVSENGRHATFSDSAVEVVWGTVRRRGNEPLNQPEGYVGVYRKRGLKPSELETSLSEGATPPPKNYLLVKYSAFRPQKVTSVFLYQIKSSSKNHSLNFMKTDSDQRFFRSRVFALIFY